MSEENIDTKSNGENGNHEVVKSSKSSNAGRRSARLCRSGKSKSYDRRLPAKGKSRRMIFKSKNLCKISASLASFNWSESICYEGQYFQTGDVVSVIDEDDNNIYYAQCKCFMTDQFCEKFVVLTWLLPTEILSENEGFIPGKFKLGPEEDFPRKMEYMTFVCNAPSTYFANMKMPYPVLESNSHISSKNFISAVIT